MKVNSCKCCEPNSMITDKIEKIGSLIKIIGEDSRLRILCALQYNSHCVCELEEHTQLSQSLISHHLRDLKNTGLVTNNKKGQKVYYSLTDFGNSAIKSILAIKT